MKDFNELTTDERQLIVSIIKSVPNWISFDGCDLRFEYRTSSTCLSLFLLMSQIEIICDYHFTFKISGNNGYFNSKNKNFHYCII